VKAAAPPQEKGTKWDVEQTGPREACRAWELHEERERSPRWRESLSATGAVCDELTAAQRPDFPAYDDEEACCSREPLLASHCRRSRCSSAAGGASTLAAGCVLCNFALGRPNDRSLMRACHRLRRGPRGLVSSDSFLDSDDASHPSPSCQSPVVEAVSCRFITPL
jgi:hypothetical protein